MKQVKYRYKNLPVPGGGYVTGFVFHNKCKDVMYIRTDIGGTYRYNFQTKRFESLTDHVGMNDLSETFPIAIGLCESKPDYFYVIGGMDRVDWSVLAISKDKGQTFEVKKLPFPAHGNWNGRGTGLRLSVDEEDPSKLVFASPRNGLYVSDDFGDTWKKKNVGGEEHLTMVFHRPKTNTYVVGTAGVTTRESETMRGASLYISYDNCETFEKMPQPHNEVIDKSRMSGFVAHRFDYDGKHLFITMNNTGEYSYIVDVGYSCDCGQVMGGRLLRYTFNEDGRISDYEDIAPNKDYKSMRYGYGGVSSSHLTHGLMALSTITRDEGDIIYRSYDYGTTWEPVLEGLRVGKIEFHTPYMKPCYNGNDSLIHWQSDIKINPFNDDDVWFNTGTGVFGSESFTAKVPVFSDRTEGIEETVHLNVYAPTGGEVKAIDIIGDLGGFAFTDLDKPCENSFADSEGNRYITCINADYSDTKPENVIATPRGNWRGKTKGGLIVSEDQCKNFRRIDLPFGINDELDKHFHDIERPNVNSGWVAMSEDANSYVWTIADGIDLPARMVIQSNDRGYTWNLCRFIDKDGKDYKEGSMKVFSDRVNPKIFYGFSDNARIFVSLDAGKTFVEKETEKQLSDIHFGRIDFANKTEIRGESGKEGVFYVASGKKGLWKMKYDANKDTVSFERLTKEGDVVHRVGLGLIAEGADYFTSNKALYVCATIDGQYGFFRSFDDGKTFELCNDAKHQYGEIISVDADKRTFGRFYLATGSHGVIYGEPCK